MASPKDSLTEAVNRILRPYLESVDFRKVTNRKFARDRGDIIQQLWVDANGVAGKQKTQIMLCCNFVFGQVQGYMDPHGFRLSSRSWNTSESIMAEESMHQIVAALRAEGLEKLEALTSLPVMLVLLEELRDPAWFLHHSALERRWRDGDAELMKVAEANRRELNLAH